IRQAFFSPPGGPGGPLPPPEALQHNRRVRGVEADFRAVGRTFLRPPAERSGRAGRGLLLRATPAGLGLPRAGRIPRRLAKDLEPPPLPGALAGHWTLLQRAGGRLPFRGPAGGGNTS